MHMHTKWSTDNKELVPGNKINVLCRRTNMFGKQTEISTLFSRKKQGNVKTAYLLIRTLVDLLN